MELKEDPILNLVNSLLYHIVSIHMILNLNLVSKICFPGDMSKSSKRQNSWGNVERELSGVMSLVKIEKKVRQRHERRRSSSKLMNPNIAETLWMSDISDNDSSLYHEVLLVKQGEKSIMLQYF